jgi:hypothetical protein
MHTEERIEELADSFAMSPVWVRLSIHNRLRAIIRRALAGLLRRLLTRNDRSDRI